MFSLAILAVNCLTVRLVVSCNKITTLKKIRLLSVRGKVIKSAILAVFCPNYGRVLLCDRFTTILKVKSLFLKNQAYAFLALASLM